MAAPKVPTLDDLISIARAAAESADPLAQLTAAAGLKTELEELTDSLLGHFVDQARRAGCSWSQIGAALGVSKQAAQQKHLPALSFERWTDRARIALASAQECSRRLGQPYVGTEHLLAGLAAVPEAVAGKILLAKALDIRAVEAAITAKIPAQDPLDADAKVAFTPKAALALAKSLEVALELGHNYIGTEHLLLALARGEETVARTILDDAELAYEAVLTQVVQFLTKLDR